MSSMKRPRSRSRATTRAAGPFTHALVIGVSQYDHFAGGHAPSDLGRQWGMEQLTCAATSAAEVANWLAADYDVNNRQTPLRSLRVLLSPARGEKVPALRGASAMRATRANVQEALRAFVDDCDRNVDNVAFVYIAGHGVQLTKHDAIVLLADAGDPRHLSPLEGAIDVTACHSAMNHPDTASTQFWFVDACRQRPELAERFVTMTGALTLPDRPGRAKVSPIFLAASSRQTAWSQIGKRSVFCEALIESLRHAAAVGPDASCPDWHVSTFSLAERLKTHVRAIARAHGEDQDVETTGTVENAVIHRLQAPPLIHLRVNLSPNKAAPFTSASLRRRREPPVASIQNNWPLIVDVNAGLYLLEVTSQPPFNSVNDIVEALTSPAVVHDVEVD
jgi:hypothetical protein